MAVMNRMSISRGNVFVRSLLLSLLPWLASCAGTPRLQSQVNTLVVSGQTDRAADLLSAPKSDYGRGNYLLYYLDRGMAEQMSGRLTESMRSFEKAKLRFRELYTQSVSREALSWALNDYSLPYRGSDYEYVLVNVFQALNYVQTGNLAEALVEARDLDAKFRVVTGLQSNDNRRRFEDNGFARLLMGLVYDAADRQGEGVPQGWNEAWIAYRQALTVYDEYYAGRHVPRLLQEEFLSAARHFSDPDFSRWRQRFSDARIVTDRERRQQARIYLVHLYGFSPVKVAESVPVPLERGVITQVSFPRFQRRSYVVSGARLRAVSSGSGFTAETEKVLDIEDLAERDLDSRRMTFMGKALLRPALKYVVERKQRENIEKHFGRDAANIFGLLASLYNFTSEQPDLRSWQTLPAGIGIARLDVDPGNYELIWEGLDGAGGVALTEKVADVTLSPGEVRFVIRRSGR